jgi:hypothetical protein
MQFVFLVVAGAEGTVRLTHFENVTDEICLESDCLLIDSEI